MTTNEKIAVAEERIKELRLLINHWKINAKPSESKGLIALKSNNYSADEKVAA